MKFIVTKKSDMVEAIKELKKGEHKDYIFEHKSGDIFYKFNKDDFEENKDVFYQRIIDSNPQPNPYYEEKELEDIQESIDDCVSLVSNEVEDGHSDVIEESINDYIYDEVCEKEDIQEHTNICETTEQNDVQEEPFEETTNISNECENNEFIEGLKITISNLTEENASLVQALDATKQLLDNERTENVNLKCEIASLNDKLLHSNLSEIKFEKLVDEIKSRGFDVELKTR